MRLYRDCEVPKLRHSYPRLHEAPPMGRMADRDIELREAMAFGTFEFAYHMHGFAYRLLGSPCWAPPVFPVRLSAEYGA